MDVRLRSLDKDGAGRPIPTVLRPENRRVLVLEDDPEVRAVLLEELRDAGYIAIGLGRGDEALAALVQVDPALVVSDVVMPGMDGLEFLGRLRDNPAFAHIPVLFVTAVAEGVSDALSDDEARELGVAGILSKPVPQEVLVDRVRAIIGGRPEGGQASRRRRSA